MPPSLSSPLKKGGAHRPYKGRDTRVSTHNPLTLSAKDIHQRQEPGEMKLKLIFALSFLFALTDASLRIRHRRQAEREDNDVVVITNNRPGPSVPSYSHDAFDLNFDENTGAFNLGGRLPTLCCHHNHGVSFADLFESLQRRFEEMTRAMMASVPGGLNGTHINDYPDGYNNTETEVVEIGGRKYLKKTTIIKKGSNDTAIFLKSTIFEPMDEGSTASPDTESVPAVESSDVNPSSVATPSSPPVPSVGSTSASQPDTSGIEREELTTKSS